MLTVIWGKELISQCCKCGNIYEAPVQSNERWEMQAAISGGSSKLKPMIRALGGLCRLLAQSHILEIRNQVQWFHCCGLAYILRKWNGFEDIESHSVSQGITTTRLALNINNNKNKPESDSVQSNAHRSLRLYMCKKQ